MPKASSRFWYSASGLALVALIGASCREIEVPQTAQKASIVAAVEATRTGLRAFAAQQHARGEAALHDLNTRVPGFAGFYISGADEITVLSTRAIPAGEVAGQVRGMADRHGLKARGGVWRVRTGVVKHTFDELVAWRDEVATSLYIISGWSSLDLDERRNRIVVGISHNSARAPALDVFRNAGVPQSAYEIRLAHRSNFTSGIKDRHRPLLGGLVGLFRASTSTSAGHDCSITAIARWRSEYFLMTASHCTQRTWWQDDIDPLLAQTNSLSIWWGYERFDHNEVCWAPPEYQHMQYCRKAEWALYSANPDVIGGEQPLAFGQLVRPLSGRRSGALNDNYGQAANIALDEANPLIIVDYLADPPVGMEVDKVGSVSGWTYGPVTESCIDMLVADVYPDAGWPMYHIGLLTCQYRADINSNAGDSGGPVFRYLGGNEVSFVGVDWGNTDGDGGIDGLFSTIGGIQEEAATVNPPSGPLVVFDGPAPPNDWIVGPAEVVGGEEATWTTNQPHSTCEWWDGQAVLTTGCILNYTFTDAPSVHYLSVYADDIYLSPIAVHVNEPGGGGCCEQLRAPTMRKKSPVSRPTGYADTMPRP